MLATRAADASCAVIYVNLVGGQDELVFDGASMVFDAEGNLVADATVRRKCVDFRHRSAAHIPQKAARPERRHRSAPLPEVMVSASPRTDFRRPPATAPRRAAVQEEEIYKALVVGTHDYVRKNGFAEVVVGLSGGIDSSLVATIARTLSERGQFTVYRCRRATRAKNPTTTPPNWPEALVPIIFIFPSSLPT